MRLTIFAAIGLLFLCGCQCDTVVQENPFGAGPGCAPMAAAPGTNLFGRECGLPVYEGPTCIDLPFLNATGKWINENIFGCPPEIPPLPSQTVQTAPIAVPVAAAPSRWGPCGPPPASAKPGENWCCVRVQPAAAAPRRVCTKPACQIAIPVAAVMRTESRQVMVAPARVEWQRVDCGGGSEEICWKLVEIPAVMKIETREVVDVPASVRYEQQPAEYEMRASAPPPAYWEWQLKEEGCLPDDAPPAGPAGSPNGS